MKRYLQNEDPSGYDAFSQMLRDRVNMSIADYNSSFTADADVEAAEEGEAVAPRRAPPAAAVLPAAPIAAADAEAAEESGAVDPIRAHPAAAMLPAAATGAGEGSVAMKAEPGAAAEVHIKIEPAYIGGGASSAAATSTGAAAARTAGKARPSRSPMLAALPEQIIVPESDEDEEAQQANEDGLSDEVIHPRAVRTQKRRKTAR